MKKLIIISLCCFLLGVLVGYILGQKDFTKNEFETQSVIIEEAPSSCPYKLDIQGSGLIAYISTQWGGDYTILSWSYTVACKPSTWTSISDINISWSLGSEILPSPSIFNFSQGVDTYRWDCAKFSWCYRNINIISWVIAHCWNGVVELPEQCDDWNTSSTDKCDNNCKLVNEWSTRYSCGFDTWSNLTACVPDPSGNYTDPICNNDCNTIPNKVQDNTVQGNDICNYEYDCNAQKSITLEQCEALKTLFISTKGCNWTQKQNRLQSNDPCNWKWVLCTAWWLVSIGLKNNNLDGTIDSNISDLSDIIVLLLSQNKIRWSIPKSISTMSKLQYLILEDNNICGSYPMELVNNIHIPVVNIRWNWLSLSKDITDIFEDRNNTNQYEYSYLPQDKNCSPIVEWKE